MSRFLTQEQCRIEIAAGFALRENCPCFDARQIALQFKDFGAVVANFTLLRYNMN